MFRKKVCLKTIRIPETWKDSGKCKSFYRLWYGFLGFESKDQRKDHFEAFERGWRSGSSQATIDMWNFLRSLLLGKQGVKLQKMSESGVWLKLKEAAGIANTIEAARSGYVSLDDKSIQHLSGELLEMLDEIRAEVAGDLNK